MMAIMGFMLSLIPLFIFSYFWLIFLFFSFCFYFFLLTFSFDFYFLNISYFLSCDLLSYTMILLSFWICLLMLMSSERINYFKNFTSFFSFCVLFLMISLFLLFSSMNIFFFYLFFEVSLIPVLFLIVGWGYQPERIQAGYYLMFYTLFASLPMMISLFFIYKQEGTMDFSCLCFNYNSFFLFFCMNFVFLIKAPMYLLHLWLPKAHVEAPVSGSMILAGVMLKLGGYGMMRLLILFPFICYFWSVVFIMISLVGGFIVGLVCLRQTDIKALIAYSSVSHMALVLAGLLSFSRLGFMGSFCLMIAHGFCSSGLFCLANINYERLNSRSLFLNKGLINLIPSLSLAWFLFSACNMAAPPSLNLLGEIILIMSLLGWSDLNMIILSLISFFAAAYSLFLYAYSQHGSFYIGIYSFYFVFTREYLLLFLHWLPLNLCFLVADFFLYYN
uniref:NADH-ubiquinone oxidoreductase chain 4 n=1 Tax=Thaumaglossa rufocapillata TaxID=3080387 RepID=A0AA96WM56_9COLE|nr:NADH dehydrogenase subunit 4 [Thaumaglossa rufocapillata]WNZ33697.1 NADH dehydrogenase subunit 4 [Thaumaglossa rufocapillata]WRK68084.1 NADH dehydrogenase subunit 4 [Thaumaglossa rufocapillata]